MHIKVEQFKTPLAIAPGPEAFLRGTGTASLVLAAALLCAENARLANAQTIAYRSC